MVPLAAFLLYNPVGQAISGGILGSLFGGLFGRRKSSAPPPDPYEQALKQRQMDAINRMMALSAQAQQREADQYGRYLQTLSQYQAGLQAMLRGLGYTDGTFTTASTLSPAVRMLDAASQQEAAIRQRLAQMGADPDTIEQAIEAQRQRAYTEAAKAAGEFDLQRRQLVAQALGQQVGVASGYDYSPLIGLSQLLNPAISAGLSQQQIALQREQMRQAEAAQKAQLLSNALSAGFGLMSLFKGGS